MRTATAAILVSQDVTLVDLDGTGFRGAAPDDPDAKRWRTIVAKEIKARKLFFKDERQFLLCETGQETTRKNAGSTRGWRRTGELHTPEGLKQIMERENRATMDLLVAQLRSPMGVVPFVGAGLSIDFGFPSWDSFLSEAAQFCSKPDEVQEKIQAGALIDAATDLFKDSPERFQRLVARWFGGEVGEDQVRAGSVGLLPLVASGPVITTNFDRVLEAAFRAAGTPFEHVVTGQEPDNVIRSMHRNERTLIKLHGDAMDRSARVFTGVEYDARYRDGRNKRYGTAVGIPQLARIMFTNRPLLFLGCSLDKDRTLNVLEELHRDLPGLNHHGVVAAPYVVSEMRRRRRELDGYAISPIWFAPGDFRRVGEILQQMLHEASTRLLWKAKPGGSWPRLRGAPANSRKAVTASIAGSTSDAVRATARRLAQRIVGSRLGFFLGAGANLDTMISARGFYRSLAEYHQFNEKESQRAEIAQYIIDRETKVAAWAAAKQGLRKSRGTPSSVIQFLAGLPSLLRQGTERFFPQWFMSTNYDTVLEDALAENGEPFHLFYYQVDGPWEGRFVHRDLDGSLRIIERPDTIRTFAEPAHVVVKLDGGIPWDPRIPETVAFSPLDFAISAGRLPTALPEVLRKIIQGQSLLILGSSLKDPHVQRLIRWSAGDRRASKTWAVKNDASATDEKFWAAAGVEIIAEDLKVLVPILRDEIAAESYRSSTN